MKKLKIYEILIFNFLFTIPFNAYPQWEMVNGLDGGQIQSMVSIDSVLIATCIDRGVYKKSDSGSWELADLYKDYKKVCKSGKCVFAYNSLNASPIRSFDHGETWEIIYSLNNTYQMWSIDTVIFFGWYINKRSFDYGTTYDTIQFPIPNQRPENILCDDSLLYAHYYDGWEFHKIFYSPDYGNTWDSIPSNGLFYQPYVRIDQLKYLNGTFWAQLSSESAPYSARSLFIFNDSISKWLEVTNNLPLSRAHNDLFEFNGKIFCSIESYPVFCFNGEDSSWVQFADPSINVNQFLVHNDELFCATKQGACSLDTAGNWTTYYSGLNLRNITSIDEFNGNIYVTANNELFISEDGGNNFTKMEGAYGFKIITTDTVFYMATLHGFRISRDNGISWNSFSDGLDDGYNAINTCFSISRDYFYIGSWRGLYRTSSDSIVWKKVESGPVTEQCDVEDVESIDTTVFVGERGSGIQGVYFSNDNGNTFMEYEEYYYPVRRRNQTYYLLKDSIYYSDDLAQTWNKIPLKINGYHAKSIDVKADTIITGGYINWNPRIEMTYDQGEHWIDLTDDLPVNNAMAIAMPIEQLKIIDGRIFIGNPDFGLWYRNDILTGSSEILSEDSKNNSFTDIYPNPFSFSTTIEFNLSQPSEVRIYIFNQLGDQVDMIEEYRQPGKQKIVWNAEDLPPGVYYLRMKTGVQTALGKVVLIK